MDVYGFLQASYNIQISFVYVCCTVCVNVCVDLHTFLYDDHVVLCMSFLRCSLILNGPWKIPIGFLTDYAKIVFMCVSMFYDLRMCVYDLHM